MEDQLKKFIASNNQNNFTDKRVLIVGGTQGLGSGVATVLAQRGASVIIAGRNEELGKQIVSKLQTLSPSKQEIVFKKVDLADLENIKQFAKDLSSERLDYLVWTAGIFAHGPRQETKDGIEKSFAINYLSRFVGINLLYQSLKPGARILSVYAPYSDAFIGKRFKHQFNIDDLELKQKGKYEELGIPQAFNIIPCITNDLFTKKFAEKHKEIIIVHQQPGFVKTDLMKNSEVPKETIENIFGDMSNFKGRTIEEYGEVAAYILTAPEIADYSGRGIDSDVNLYEANEFILDPHYADKVWDYSAKLGNL